jgi:hypothetical protein
MDDPDISDGASDNDYSDHEQEVEKDDDDNAEMAEQSSRSDIDRNGKAMGSNVATKPKLDPKDPLRPKGKKSLLCLPEGSLDLRYVIFIWRCFYTMRRSQPLSLHTWLFLLREPYYS